MSQIMDDRVNDWLGQELAREGYRKKAGHTQAPPRSSGAANRLRQEHERMCDAQMGKAQHKKHCDADALRREHAADCDANALRERSRRTLSPGELFSSQREHPEKGAKQKIPVFVILIAAYLFLSLIGGLARA